MKILLDICENEEVIISDYSDSSEQVNIPDLTNSSEIEENISNNKQIMDYICSDSSLTKGKKEFCIKEEVHILDSIDYSDDENILIKKVHIVNNETTIKKNENRNKLIVNGLIHEQIKQSEKYSEYFRFNYENFSIDEELFITTTFDDNNKIENTNSKINNDYQDPLLLESDDWYYLNIANAPKISNITNNILPNEKNIKLDYSIIKQKVVKNINSKIKVKVKKSKGKHRNQDKSILSKGNIKLQGKIVRRNIKNSEINIQNVYSETNFVNEDSMHMKSSSTMENINNISCIKSCTMESIIDFKKEPFKDISYKTDQVCIIKEETILPDCYVVEAVENSKTTTLSDENTFIKIDYSKDDLQNNFNEIDQQIVNKEKNIASYYREKHRRKPKMIVKCSTCGKGYERVGHFRRHQVLCNTIRTVIYFECAMCPYKTKNKIAFRNHLGNHILGEAYNNTSHNKRIAKGRFKISKNKMNTKEFCPPSYLKAHCMTCNEEMTAIERIANCKKCLGMFVYWCVLCHKDFPTYSRLRRHVLDSLKVSTVHKCSKCGKSSYTSMCRLRRHEMFCGIKPIIQCSKLPYVRLVRYNAQIIQRTKGPWRTLQTHCLKCNRMRIVLDPKAKCEKCDSLLSYKCEICKELSSTYFSLRAHVLKAHIIDSQQCTECDGECNHCCSSQSSFNSMDQKFSNQKKIISSKHLDIVYPPTGHQAAT